MLSATDCLELPGNEQHALSLYADGELRVLDSVVVVDCSRERTGDCGVIVLETVTAERETATVTDTSSARHHRLSMGRSEAALNTAALFEPHSSANSTR